MKVRYGGVASYPKEKSVYSVQAPEKIIRTKERTVKEIIEKVMVWRKLYNGITMPNKDQDNKV